MLVFSELRLEIGLVVFFFIMLNLIILVKVDLVLSLVIKWAYYSSYLARKGPTVGLF